MLKLVEIVAMGLAIWTAAACIAAVAVGTLLRRADEIATAHRRARLGDRAVVLQAARRQQAGRAIPQCSPLQQRHVRARATAR